MPRRARERSRTGIYHVMTRGANRRDIFHEEEDYKRYLELLRKTKDISGCIILGYCLMDNHVHLLIKEGQEDISKIMKRLGVSYASWYNWKYECTGHVFQGRFKSECIESEKYLIAVIRYIHQNPVEAKIVQRPEKYRWSSCRVYYGGKEYPEDLIHTDFILNLFADKKVIAIKLFIKYMLEENNDKFLEDETKKRIKDGDVYREIQKILKGKPISILQEISAEERNKVLREVKGVNGITLRQISRITGFSVNTIFKA